MRRLNSSIENRILLPIFALVAVLTSALLLLAYTVSNNVREDYQRFTVTASASHVTTILEMAAADLTAARLGDNPVVVEAKQGAVREAISLFWSRNGLQGIIAAADGTVLNSTLEPEEITDVLARLRPGYFTVPGPGGKLHCLAQTFPLWGWTVTSVMRHSIYQVMRKELTYLLPLVLLGALVLLWGLHRILHRNLQRPVAEMIAAVETQRDVPPTGIAEFDGIGSAVNQALARVRERSTQLAGELEQRRRAEAALRDKEERIRLLLNSTAEGIYGVDTAGICTFCNPACLRMLGYDREEDLLGRNIHEIVHHTRRDGTVYPEAECRILLAYRERRGVHAEDEVFWRKDGSSFPVEYWSHPVIDDEGVTGAVVAFFDTTQHTVLEQQLRQSQKMEAVGRLAGGIAHDFNNMLMAIVGYASMARELSPAGSKPRHYSEQVLSAAEKATDLTRQILAFSRKQMMSPAPVDLNGVILGMGKIIARVLGEDIQIGLDLSGTKLVAMADRGQIEQVLMNLFTNARDAMPAGGRLAIGTKAIPCNRESAEIHGLEVEGWYALITVSDTGTGMDPKTREKIFEPFFTTKELGKGTGLGLSIVYGIIKQHHGQISVYSELGRGTTFRIYLPLTSDEEFTETAQPPIAVRGGAETVLLAEDNEDVRNLARQVLEDAGYRVLTAGDGEEAVRLFAANPNGIGLCLIDVVMPRKTGKQALDEIRALRPGARALFMSGYAADILGDAKRAGPDVVILAKPLLPQELLRKVRETLDA